jgi:hypothetical protein
VTPFYIFERDIPLTYFKKLNVSYRNINMDIIKEVRGMMSLLELKEVTLLHFTENLMLEF